MVDTLKVFNKKGRFSGGPMGGIDKDIGEFLSFYDIFAFIQMLLGTVTKDGKTFYKEMIVE